MGLETRREDSADMDAKQPIEALPVIYHDDAIIAVFKPGGLLVHRSMLDSAETQFAMQILRDQIGQYVYPVHRLDRPTSGILLFALSSEVARTLGEQFAARQVHKTYQAIVRGYVEPQGCIDYPLKEELDKIADKQAQTDKAPQPAVSHYRCLRQYELPFAVGRYATARYSHIELFPETGRKHQLRRHMAHIRHPIVGDTTHGDGKHNRFMREQFQLRGLALCATRLQLAHPISGEALDFHVQLDPRMENVLTQWDGCY